MAEESSEVADAIRRVIVASGRLECAPGDIGLDQPLHGPESLGLHSIDIFDMVMELETKLEIQIPDDEIQKLNSVAAILAFVESRRNA